MSERMPKFNSRAQNEKNSEKPIVTLEEVGDLWINLKMGLLLREDKRNRGTIRMEGQERRTITVALGIFLGGPTLSEPSSPVFALPAFWPKLKDIAAPIGTKLQMTTPASRGMVTVKGVPPGRSLPEKSPGGQFNEILATLYALCVTQRCSLRYASGCRYSTPR